MSSEFESREGPQNKVMKLTRLAPTPGRMRQGAAAWPRRRGSAATACSLSPVLGCDIRETAHESG